jgi:hypothetical protein
MEILYMVRQYKSNGTGLEVHEKTYPFINVETAIAHHKKLEKENEFKINTRFEIVVEYED